MKGWYGNSQKHSLASRGIKSSLDIRYSKGTEPEVISVLERKGIPEFFRTDIENYNFSFISDIYKNPENYLRRGKTLDIVMMPVSAYIRAVEMGNNLDYIDFMESKIESIEEGIEDGAKFHIPYLEYSVLYWDGKPYPRFGQEGLHRAYVSKKRGYSYIPVILVYPAEEEEFKITRKDMTGTVILSVDMDKVKTEEERKKFYSEKYGRYWNL